MIEDDSPFWLPPSGDFAKEIGKAIFHKFSVRCYFDKIFKDLGFSNQQLLIGWILLFPDELSKQFEKQDVYSEFSRLVYEIIKNKYELGLREYFLSRREIRLIYANENDISQYIVEHYTYKYW